MPSLHRGPDPGMYWFGDTPLYVVRDSRSNDWIAGWDGVGDAAWWFHETGIGRGARFPTRTAAVRALSAAMTVKPVSSDPLNLARRGREYQCCGQIIDRDDSDPRRPWRLHPTSDAAHPTTITRHRTLRLAARHAAFRERIARRVREIEG